MSFKAAMNWTIGIAAVLLAVIVSHYVNTYTDLMVNDVSPISHDNYVAVSLGSSVPSMLGVITIGLLALSVIMAMFERSPLYMFAIAAVSILPAALFGVYLPTGQRVHLMVIGTIATIAAAGFKYLGQRKLTVIPEAPDAPSAAMTHAAGRGREKQHTQT